MKKILTISRRQMLENSERILKAVQEKIARRLYLLQISDAALLVDKQSTETDPLLQVQRDSAAKSLRHEQETDARSLKASQEASALHRLNSPPKSETKSD